LSGGTLAIGFWVLLAVWVIGSSFVAPAIVSYMIITGGSGIGRVFGGTIGVGAYMAYTAAKNAGVGGAASAIGSASSGSPAASRTSRPNYARRPPAPPAVV
jgi:hypothetical protein